MSRIRANTITNQNANGAPNFPDGITVSGVVTATTTSQNITGNLSVTGNIGVGGTITYEDVTNIDSVGVITARSGIDAASNLLLKTGGSERVRINSTGNMGLGVSDPNVLNEPSKFQELTLGGKTEGAGIHLKDDNGNVQGGLFTSDNTGAMIVRTITNHYMQFRTNNTERLRIGESGQIGIGGANYGTSGQVLTSQGSGSAVQWASAGTTVADQWRVSSTFTLGGNVATLSSNWERSDTPGYGQLGSGMTESSGVFTFPSTGIYLINFNLQVYSTSALRYFGLRVQTSINNMGAVSNATESFSNFDTSNGSGQYGNCYAQTLFDVTNTSTHKVRFAGMSITGSATDILGSSTANLTSVVFLRLGNT